MIFIFVSSFRFNFVDFCHDSANQASLMALAAPKVQVSSLEIDDIVLFGAFRIEEDDAAVVEVEGDAGARVVDDGVPLCVVGTDVVEEHNRLLVALAEERLIIGIGRNDRQLDGGVGDSDDVCLPTAGLQVVGEAYEVDDLRWLAVVGQSQA